MMCSVIRWRLYILGEIYLFERGKEVGLKGGRDTHRQIFLLWVLSRHAHSQVRLKAEATSFTRSALRMLKLNASAGWCRLPRRLSGELGQMQSSTHMGCQCHRSRLTQQHHKEVICDREGSPLWDVIFSVHHIWIQDVQSS